MTINPLRDYVVLEEIKEEKLLSGIVVNADADTMDSPRAKVLSKGPEVGDLIAVGSVVAFKPHLFDVFYPDMHGKVKYLIGREEAVIGIIAE